MYPSIMHKSIRAVFAAWLAVVSPIAASAQEMPASPPAAVDAQSLLARPDMTDDEILAWAAEAAVASMTFSYKDYQPRLKHAAGYFTEAGWKQFSAGMASAQFLDIMVAQKRSMIATITGKGAVVQQGLADGAFAWHIVLPMTLNYRSEDGDAGVHRMNLSLLVARSGVNRDGRGIVDWGQVPVEDKPAAPAAGQ